MIEDKNIVVIRSIKDYLDNNISDNDFKKIQQIFMSDNILKLIIRI